jgi:hypothetical protein
MHENVQKPATYSARDTAAILGVGKDSIYRAIRAGRVPTITICTHKHLIPAWWVHAQINAPFDQPTA